MAKKNGDGTLTATEAEIKQVIRMEVAKRQRASSSTRAPGEWERVTYAPLWSTQAFGRLNLTTLALTQPQGKTRYFRDTPNRTRQSNTRVAGQIPQDTRVAIFALMPLYWTGTSAVDWAALQQQMIITFKFGQRDAYQLLASAVQPSIGFVDAGLPSFGTPGTQASTVGKYEAEGGETFELVDELDVAAPIAQPVVKTYQLQLMNAEPA